MYEGKQTVVETLENELRHKLCRQNDEDFFFADLTGLFVDIIYEIAQTEKSQTVIIYDYAKLLEQELQLYSGEAAYIAGSRSKGEPEFAALSGYLCEIEESGPKRRLDVLIQAKYDEIKRLLGDRKGLLDDLTETYRTVHGITKNNLRDFIGLGRSGAMVTV
jgi:hypothetical protein